MFSAFQTHLDGSEALLHPLPFLGIDGRHNREVTLPRFARNGCVLVVEGNVAEHIAGVWIGADQLHQLRFSVEKLGATLLLYYGVEDRERIITGRSFCDELIASGWSKGPVGEFEYVEVEAKGHNDENPSRQTDRWSLFVEFSTED